MRMPDQIATAYPAVCGVGLTRGRAADREIGGRYQLELQPRVQGDHARGAIAAQTDTQ